MLNVTLKDAMLSKNEIMEDPLHFYFHEIGKMKSRFNTTM